MKTFEQFKAWLKDLHRWEFFVSLMKPNVEPCDFYHLYGTKSFIVASKQVISEKDYNECRRLDVLFNGFINEYPVYVVDKKRVVIASLYKSEDISDADMESFYDLYPNAEFDEDCFAIYAYKLEKTLKKIG